jgi:dTDP-4-dehydrorhamnose 3,5-epimerase
MIETNIEGCYRIQLECLSDMRGTFIKTFHSEVFKENGLCFEYAEEYYSVSRKRVIRGLHFQSPPKDHVKIVYCISGEIFDVAVDLRIESKTYGKFEIFNLNSDLPELIYLSKGLAHGFLTKSSFATVCYKVSTAYSPENDKGIMWNSLGIPWEEMNPIVSKRDNSFPKFSDFRSPFYL